VIWIKTTLYDVEIVRVIDDVAAWVLGDDLKVVKRRNIDRLNHRLMHSGADRRPVGRRLSLHE
jgi:hypothetical protein